MEEDAGDSGIHAVGAPTGAVPAVRPLTQEDVTLIVYGWKSVEPGTLWWVFPSLNAALAAARAMRNAVKWAIVAGTRGVDVDVEEERASGAILAEQVGLSS